MYNIQIITYWSLCCSLTFHYFQDDTYTESYISTIGVDFVSTIYTLTLSFISTTVPLDLNIDLNIAQYVTYWFKRIIHHINAFHFKGGGPGLSNLKTRFWPMGWGWWPGHEPTTWVWFWVHVRNTVHVRPRSIKWVKNWKIKRIR